jgi:hypothetical protein
MMGAAAAASLLALAGCGAATRTAPSPGPPIGVGAGPAYTPPARAAAGAAGAPVGDLSCTSADGPREGAHVELFAHRRVVLVPAGIGMAPPLAASGAYVRAARCSYPVRTREPTGLLELHRGAARTRSLTLGDLFRVWGQPLSSTRLAGFHAPRGERVVAYLDGRRWSADPRAVPLRRHAVIVLEVAGFVPPHTTYRFPSGLSLPSEPRCAPCSPSCSP